MQSRQFMPMRLRGEQADLQGDGYGWRRNDGRKKSRRSGMDSVVNLKIKELWRLTHAGDNRWRIEQAQK